MRAIEHSPASLRTAGELFEQARARGASLESAMREADGALRAAREARTADEPIGPIPTFARGVLATVAAHHGVTVQDLQLRGSKPAVILARQEAAVVLLRAELSPSQVGVLLRRDRYVATAAARKVDERLHGGDRALAARLDGWVAEATQVKRGDELGERRPPRRSDRGLDADAASPEGVA